jgi:hypothetical protein
MAPPRDFLPSRDGFAFDNTWPPAPGLPIRTPFGTVGLGNAAAGLCGGMVFAALDYWVAGVAPPAARPGPGTPLYRYVVRRLIDSWHLPAGVARYYLWMNLAGQDYRPEVLRQRAMLHGLGWRTSEQHWPRVRASIDGGHPAALGIVTMASARPGLLGRNHQVLAYGYDVSGGLVTLRVYDPNSGPSDDVQIRFDPAAAAQGSAFEHNIGIRWPVRGFFVTAYSPATPPPISAPGGPGPITRAGPCAASESGPPPP